MQFYVATERLLSYLAQKPSSIYKIAISYDLNKWLSALINETILTKILCNLTSQMINSLVKTGFKDRPRYQD